MERTSTLRLPLSRHQIIALLAVVGVFFLAVSFYSLRSSSPVATNLRVATLVHQTGKVEIIKAGLTQRIKVKVRDEVDNFDSVETFEVGEANLIFENGFHVRVFANSLLTFERINDPENEHVVLLIKRGEIRVDKKVKENQLMISKDGRRTDAMNYEPVSFNPTARADDRTGEENESSTPNESHSTLTDDEISGTMNNHRTSFLKCYARLAQKNPRIKGEATLTFTIENTGKTSTLGVTTLLEPNVKDEEFTKCLKDIVQRISFKPFRGPQVSTIFPLKFD